MFVRPVCHLMFFGLRRSFLLLYYEGLILVFVGFHDNFLRSQPFLRI